MITSALIKQCRQDCDTPKSTQASRAGNGTINLFNVGKFPIVENSYTVYRGTSALTEGTGSSQFQLDKDNGDLRLNSTPSNGQVIKAQFKYAQWNDANWLQAINEGIEQLNGRGFFKQVIRQSFTISGGIRSFSGPSACVDMYELLYSPTSGRVLPLQTNWSYQQDANKVVLGGAFSTAQPGVRSYLRNIQQSSSTSATLDVKDDWIEPLKKYAEAKFYRMLAGKIARQGNATVDEGHFSFTNLRTQANDLEAEFSEFARRKKPTRPTKDMQYHITGGGTA